MKKLLSTTLDVNLRVRRGHNISKIWSGRGGGRHYILWRTMISMADHEGKIRASRRDLHVASNITSHSGLQRSIDHLVKYGVIEILDPGTPDLHQHEAERTKGRAATYMIRQQGSTTHDGLLFATTSASSLLVHVKHDQDGGRSPLPNVDHRLDIFGDEPHLLRLCDIIAALGATGYEASPTAISKALGISPGSAHEFIGRLRERQMVRDGWIDLEDVLYFGRGWERQQSIARSTMRETAIRVEALAGRWVPRRMRVAQRFVTKTLERFSVIDWDGVARITEAQTQKFKTGMVPWLDTAELAMVRST